MKKSLAFLIVFTCAIGTQVFAAFPFYEPFADATASGGSAYAIGSKVAGQTNANGPTVVWADNNTGAVDVAPTNATGNLVYPGLPASSGGMSYFTNVTARTTRVTLPSTITSGIAYYSYKLQITDIGNLASGGAYLNGFSAGTGTSASSITALAARLWAKKIDADHFVLGISKNTASVTLEVVFDTTQYTTNDVLFIVAGYTFSGSANNDTASLWINPGSLGAASAPTATLPDTGLTFANASATVASFLFGNRATTIASGNIDDIRVGTSWKNVTGGVTITGQPSSVATNAGGTVKFTVAATQTGATYQWKKNGVNLTNGNPANVSGATSATLTLTGVYTADADSYTVDVIGSNIETSSPATLTVNDPVITTQPNPSVTSVPGSTTNLTIIASGTAPLSYRWKKGGVNLTDGGHVSGSTTATLTLSSVNTGDNGLYSCGVTNFLGASIVSSNSDFSVANDPDILSDPVSRTNNYGTEATFTVVGTGTPTLTYRWQKNGNNLSNGGNIAGATAATLTIISAGDPDEGNYTVVVTNTSGSVTSSIATLTVIDPIINSQPVSITNNAGTTATFTVAAVGTPTLTYRWKKGAGNLTDGGNISGSGAATLTISSVASGDTGSYSVIVSNSVGSFVTSSVATLTVKSPPVITSAPSSRKVNVGVNVAFGVAATTDAGPLGYQWQSNLVDIAGATSAILSLSNVQVTDSATYTVVVTNDVGPTTASAILNVTTGNLRLFNTNLIVLRQGKADQPVATNGNSVSLDQYTTAGAYVSTTVIPDQGENALINDPALSVFSGGLSRSADGKELSFAGFNTNRPSYTNLSLSTTAGALSIRRTVGKVNGLSLYAIGSTTTAFNGNAPRGGVTDGTNNYWAGSATLSVRYYGPSPTATGVNVGSASALGSFGIRQLRIINGVLYFSTSSTGTLGTGSNLGVWKWGALPTAAESPVNVVNTLTGSSPGEFALSPDGSIMYVADERTTSAGGVQCWDVGGSTLLYTITNGIAGLGVRGLTVDFSGPNPVIYGSTAELTNNRLFTVTDIGASSTAIILARAGINQAFRGVEFGPISDPPAITAQPVSVTNNVGTTATFTVAATGTGPLSYQWKKNGSNLSDGGNISGATSATLTLASVSGADADSYTVEITGAGVLLSDPATLTVNAAAGQPTDFISTVAGTGSFVGTPGATYTVQYTDSLSPVNWQTLTNVVTDGGTGVGTFTDPTDPATLPERYYRVTAP